MNPDQSPDHEVGEANFDSAVLESKLPVLVLFWASWSQPCHIIEAVLGEVAAVCAGRVKIVRINADDHPDLSLWYEIQSIPTLLFFQDGALCGKVVGTASKEAILTKMSALFHPGENSPTAPENHPDEEHHPQ